MTIESSTTIAGRYEIHLPPPSDRVTDQDEEWCSVRFPDGVEQRIRFHDYEEIYSHPGLYEQLFAERLACSSPEVVVGLLERELASRSVQAASLSVLDLGAGNGMVGEELARLGARVVGVDIIAGAASAAARDRPGRYERYLVADLTTISPDVEDALRARGLNALTCVAALGFGDIPPLVFATAYDLLDDGAWLAFNIREDFLSDPEHRFAQLIVGMQDDGWIETLASRRYVHRVATDGRPLHYVALVGRKRGRPDARARARELTASG